jgi:CSLREA domain-containing protein
MPLRNNPSKFDEFQRKEQSMRHQPLINKIFRVLIILLLLSLYFGIDVKRVSAISIIVNTTNDEEIDDSTCSLREAVQAALNHADYYGCTGGASAWVKLPSGRYTVDLGTLPPINTAITINGAGSSKTVIQPSSCNPVEDDCPTNHRLFYIASTGDLTLENLTIRNGYVEETYGGAIWNNQGTLNIHNSVFSANRSQRGGAIENTGALYITESTFSSNMVGIDQVGGAIYNYNLTQSALIEKSTFSNNSANYGGAIWNVGAGGVLEIINCTFSGNTAGNYGGAMVNNGPAILTNNTFSENSALSGAGIYISAGKDLSLKNTIIANSTGDDCTNFGTISTNLNNLIETGNCSPAYTGDPSLGPLANNGGPTQTHALQSSSIAIDNGNLAACPGTDQRGIARPQGGGCDIGAYEREPFTYVYLPLIMK